jgi:hypothetical protein
MSWNFQNTVISLQHYTCIKMNLQWLDYRKDPERFINERWFKTQDVLLTLCTITKMETTEAIRCRNKEMPTLIQEKIFFEISRRNTHLMSEYSNNSSFSLLFPIFEVNYYYWNSWESSIHDPLSLSRFLFAAVIYWQIQNRIDYSIYCTNYII